MNLGGGAQPSGHVPLTWDSLFLVKDSQVWGGDSHVRPEISDLSCRFPKTGNWYILLLRFASRVHRDLLEPR